jgi:cytoplasmic iron level regulating protein YaaA (DUF328/UPF0246 family)
MLSLLSPSKTQDFSPFALLDLNYSIPEFIKEAKELVKICKKLDIEEIVKLMKISAKLSESTFTKFQEYDTATNTGVKPAFFAYIGDVYNAMNPMKYGIDNLVFANKNFRIISGLYGLLKPLDLIQAYRLEMAIRLNNIAGKDLYCFWQDKLTQYINQELKTHQEAVLINLASEEYISAISSEKLKGKLINIIFKENRNGKLQIIGLNAKKARGLMADYIISNQIQTSEQLKDFNRADYSFVKNLSNNNEFVFVR